jgi:Peptidase of plants and bacteria
MSYSIARRSALLIAVCLLLGSAAGSADDAAKEKAAVTITARSEDPEQAEWAEAARKRCELWHPLIMRILGNDSEPKHKEISIVVRPMRGIAATGGARISVSADYVKQHPDDEGMIVHELVHVVQAYPNPNPGWLTEGIADYIRYWHYEPGKREFPIRERSSYKNSYGTTARFLAWVQVAKDAKIVQKLDAAMRKGEYKDELFEQATGRTLDQLWAEFAQTAIRAPQPKPAEEQPITP